MYYPHLVQGGVGPYHPAAPGFPQPPAATADSLSVAVAIKSEQISASHKQDVSGPPPQAPGPQAYPQPGGQFSPPLLGAQPPNVLPSGPPSLPLSLPVGGITNGIEQQTVSIRQFVHSAQPDLLQQTEPESGQQALEASIIAAASSGANLTIASSALATMAPISTSVSTMATISSSDSKNQPKRLHVSNIPFRFRDPDLRTMFGQFGTILDVEIIFNERGSKGFGFVTFANSSDAERARERLHGTVVEGRKIEVNNATARVQTKKAPTVPQVCLTKDGAVAAPALVCVQWPEATAALRGVAIQRGRARAAFPAAAAAAAAFARLPAPLAAAAGAANALHGYTPVYYDPFLAAAAAQADPNYRLQATAPLLKTPLSQAQQQAYTAAATYTAVAGMRAAYGAAAAAQPVAGYAAVAGYGREYADPYLGHGIGPVPGYGAAMYRGSYNRFTPY